MKKLAWTFQTRRAPSLETSLPDAPAKAAGLGQKTDKATTHNMYILQIGVLATTVTLNASKFCMTRNAWPLHQQQQNGGPCPEMRRQKHRTVKLVTKTPRNSLPRESWDGDSSFSKTIPRSMNRTVKGHRADVCRMFLRFSQPSLCMEF